MGNWVAVFIIDDPLSSCYVSGPYNTYGEAVNIVLNTKNYIYCKIVNVDSDCAKETLPYNFNIEEY